MQLYLRQCPVAANELRVVGVDVCMLTVHKIPDHALSRSSALTDEVLDSCSQSDLQHQHLADRISAVFGRSHCPQCSQMNSVARVKGKPLVQDLLTMPGDNVLTMLVAWYLDLYSLSGSFNH